MIMTNPSLNMSCPDHTYKCGSGECILDVYMCDGVKQCQDGNDEAEQCDTDMEDCK